MSATTHRNVMSDDPWHADRINLLSELLSQGLSYSDIGIKMGGKSKSAISGKVQRMRRYWPDEFPVRVAANGHPRPAGQIAAPKRRPHRKVPTPPRRTLPDLGRAVDTPPVAVAPKPTPQPPTPPAPSPAMLLLTHKCQWPMWTDAGRAPRSPRDFDVADARYCEAPAPLGRPYCAKHARVAFNYQRPAAFQRDF